MGKAKTLHDSVIARPLTAAELERREAEATSGGDVQAMPDGRLVKIEIESETPREVGQAPSQTWD